MAKNHMEMAKNQVQENAWLTSKQARICIPLYNDWQTDFGFYALHQGGLKANLSQTKTQGSSV